jgi:hypothetical protein
MGSANTFAATEGIGSNIATKTMAAGEHSALYDQAPSKVVENLVRKAYGTFGTSLADQSLVLTDALYMFVDNTTDSDIDLGYDGTDTKYCVRAKSAREIILKEGATAIYAKRTGTMTEGEVTFELTR